MATYQVEATTDDCQRRLTTYAWALTGAGSAALAAGALNDTWYQYGGGMRFTSITIPPGAVIDSAYLTLRASVDRTGEVVNTRISAEDVDDAPTFADDAGAFDTRWANRTTAKVAWDAIPAWTQNRDYNSPDIKAVIQEIVDRVGWASGNDIVIFWEDFDGRSSLVAAALRTAYSYDGNTTYAPKLVITYTAISVYPAVDTSRVSSIRHIFRPGFFRMQAGLGDLGFDVDVAETTVRRELDTAKVTGVGYPEILEVLGMTAQEFAEMGRKLAIGKRLEFPTYEAQIEYEEWFQKQIEELREMGWEG